MAKFYTSVLKKSNKIYVRGYEDGKRFYFKDTFSPKLYLPTKAESKYKTIHGDPVREKIFKSPNEMWSFQNQYKDVAGFEYYGMEDSVTQYIYEKYPKIMEEYNPSIIRTCIIDIEVDTTGGYPDIDLADKMLTAITMIFPDITIALGYGDYTPTDEKIKYFKCKNEKDLIKKFLKIWDSSRFGPDVVSGWNIETFDIPYLVNRITRIFDYDEACRLSPWGYLQERTLHVYGKDQKVYYPSGIAILDYINMYKKFIAVTKPQENYKLDHIAFVELGEKKLDYSTYGSLHKLAKENHQLFMEYNIKDCALVERLDKKYNLFRLAYNVAYSTGVNFADSMGTVKSWDAAIYRYLEDRCVVVPKKTKNNPDKKLVGGYVKDPIKGSYKWVVSFDLTSLYPSLIRQYNIGPDTFIEQLPDHYTANDMIENKHSIHHNYLDENNYAMTANSCVYSKDKKSFLSQLMEDLFNNRASTKKNMKELERNQESGEKNLGDKISELDTLQYAIKVRLNALYGSLGNKHFRWYDIKHAEAITITGQLTVKWAEHYVNKYMNKIAGTENIDYIIMIDTDSIYVNMEPVIKSSGLTDTNDLVNYMDNQCENKFDPFINTIFEKLKQVMRAPQMVMHMKREAIADRGVFVAKKRYIINVLDNEGVRYTKPDCKIIGLASRRSETPSACKVAIAEVARIAVQGDEKEMHEYIKEFGNKFSTLSYDEISKNTSVNGLYDYSCPIDFYKKGTPIHVRAALVYNRLVDELGIKDKLEPIFEGEKIKWCYTKLPNPGREDVIASPSSLPKEFGMDEYIDRHRQYEKTFMKPVVDVLNVMNWTPEPVNKMSSFYE